MIAILFDPDTQIAKLAFSVPVTAGSDVPVRIIFTSAPNAVTDIELGLVSDDAAPATLAFTDSFVSENATVWEAMLDTNDQRLLDALAGEATLQVGLALVCTIDGARLVNSALSVVVRPPVLAGPTATVGGPNYYTQTEVLALIAAMLTTNTTQDITGVKTILNRLTIGAGSIFEMEGNVTFGDGSYGFSVSAASQIRAGLLGVLRIATAATTVTSADFVIIGNAPSTPFTATLPAASTNANRRFEFKNKGAATMTIDATGLGQLFDTSAVNTLALTVGKACILQSDGATWCVLAKY